MNDEEKEEFLKLMDKTQEKLEYLIIYFEPDAVSLARAYARLVSEVYDKRFTESPLS